MKTFRRFGKNTWVEFDEDDCPDLESLVKLGFWLGVIFVACVAIGHIFNI